MLLWECNILQDAKSISVITEFWQVKSLQDIADFLKAKKKGWESPEKEGLLLDLSENGSYFKIWRERQLRFIYLKQKPLEP